MSDTYQNRRQVLRKLIAQWEGPGALARKLGYRNSSFLIQMAGPNPTREVTEKTARQIERRLDLPLGFMDGEPAAAADPPPPVDLTLVTECVRLVGQTCEDVGLRLSPSKFADLVALVYSDCMESRLPPRPGYVRKLLQLMK